MRKYKKLPKRSKLLYLFCYDGDTGILYCRNKNSKMSHMKIGDRVGTKIKSGYIYISVDGEVFAAHRIVYKMFIGRLHVQYPVDHIDRNPSNNRIDNLVLKTPFKNNQNTGMYKNNTSGVTGVTKHKQSDKWYVQISDGNKRYSKLFKKFENAVEYRKKKEKEFGYHINHGI